MIKKSIVAVVVIVATAALVFGASNHMNSTDNSDQGQQSLSADNGTSDSSTSDKTTNETKISPSEAQKLAQKYIEEPGATAGTPTLNKNVYTVPVILNGTNVGEIDINAITGKNVGGAGGVP